MKMSQLSLKRSRLVMLLLAPPETNQPLPDACGFSLVIHLSSADENKKMYYRTAIVPFNAQ